MAKGKQLKLVKITAAILIILLSIFFFSSIVNNRDAYKDSIKLTDGWSVDINGTKYSNINLDNFKFKSAGRGDVLTLSTVVPDCNYLSPVMTFVLYHAAFEIYTDENLVYEYGTEDMKNGKMLESGYNWIQLPKDIRNKQLKIVIKFNEPNSQSNITVPIISEATSAYKYFISENLSFICIGIFLIVFGVCIIITAILLYLTENDINLLIYTGAFSFLIGLWIVCNKGIICLVSDDRILNMWLEYFSLYLASIPIFLYMIKIRKNEPNRLFVYPIQIFFVINVAAIIITLILHFANITHFPNTLTVYHLIDLLVIAFFIVTGVYLQIKHKKTEENILLIGIVFIAIFAGTDIIFFNLGKYLNPFFLKFVGISSWGSLFLIISMLFSFGLSMYRNISYKVEQATLISLAFTDPLTKLSNRAKLFRTIRELIDSNKNYGIINFDLNNLKESNDKYGHQTGDAMLRDFANVITKSFTDAAVVARVGGDEFYILYENPVPKQIDKALKEYEKNIELTNKEEKVYSLYAAYGVAYNTEIPDGNQDDVVRLSDKRMYAMKASM